MARLGVMLLVLGVGSFIPPLFGLQFRLLAIFGDAQPIVALVMAALGGFLLFLQAKSNA